VEREEVRVQKSSFLDDVRGHSTFLFYTEKREKKVESLLISLSGTTAWNEKKEGRTLISYSRAIKARSNSLLEGKEKLRCLAMLWRKGKGKRISDSSNKGGER